MRSLATFAAVGMLAVGCQSEQAPTPKESVTVSATPATFNPDGAPTITFEVPDMKCQYACVDAVKTALAAQPGAKDVKVDFETKQATVVIDETSFDSEAALATLVDYQFTNSKLHADQ